MGKILPAAYLLAAGRIPAEDSLAAVVVTHDSHGQVINMCVRVVLSVGSCTYRYDPTVVVLKYLVR